MMEEHEVKRVFDRHLRSLRFQAGKRQTVMDRALGKEEPVLKKKLSVALIFAIALVLVSVAALAVTLVQRSAESGAIVAANEALYEKYGLTMQTVGLFTPEATQADGQWTVNYIANGYAPALLGQYQVTVKGGKALKATWSYDGTAVDYKNGDLTSPVWGQKQMEEALQNPELASQISAPLYEMASDAATPPPDRQEGDAWWLGELVHPGAPQAENLTQEAAMAIAWQAVREEYGFTQSELESAESAQAAAGVAAGEPLFYTRDAGNPIWTFGFSLVKDGVDMDVAVIVDAVTGEVLLTQGMTGGNG